MSDGLTFSAHRRALMAGRHVRVVNYHNTVASGRDALKAALATYAESFVPLSLADLDVFFATGAWPDERPGFFPVFYEGFRNAYEVARPVCEELGLTGWFAICTGFIDCPPAEQEVFARSHWLELAGEELDGRRLAMTWDEVADVAAEHVVFAHTASHTGIADTVTDDHLHREVADSKLRLDAATGQNTAAFAWLWGSPYGSSPRHDDALRAAGYRYVVSNTMIQRINPPPGTARCDTHAAEAVPAR